MEQVSAIQSKTKQNKKEKKGKEPSCCLKKTRISEKAKSSSEKLQHFNKNQVVLKDIGQNLLNTTQFRIE